jgi:hypothetical protein
MFKFLGTVVNTAFKTTLLVTVGALGFAYLTKPTDESFGEEISKKAPLGTQTLTKTTINSTSTIKDYVVFKVAKLPLESSDMSTQYLGVAHHWIKMGKE